MKPKDSQIKAKKAYENDNVPDWWDSEPTHEELIAAEIDSQRHSEHENSSPWLKEASKKGPTPF